MHLFDQVKTSYHRQQLVVQTLSSITQTANYLQGS